MNVQFGHPKYAKLSQKLFYMLDNIVLDREKLLFRLIVVESDNFFFGVELFQKVQNLFKLDFKI